MKLRIKAKIKKREETAEITSEFIRLDSLLRFMAAVETGGDAKTVIQDGMVKVNGEICTQRGKKLYPGDTAEFRGVLMTVRKAEESGE